VRGAALPLEIERKNPVPGRPQDRIPALPAICLFRQDNPPIDNCELQEFTVAKIAICPAQEKRACPAISKILILGSIYRTPEMAGFLLYL
jgi:hypothetical protein